MLLALLPLCTTRPYIGPYALPRMPNGTAHVAGYALTDSGESLGEREQNAGFSAVSRSSALCAPRMTAPSTWAPLQDYGSASPNRIDRHVRARLGLVVGSAL